MEINNQRLTRDEELRLVSTRLRNSSRRIRIDFPQKSLAEYVYRYTELTVKTRTGGIGKIENAAQIKSAVDVISKLLTTDNGKCGFMLLGNVGVGKTTILRALQQSFLGLAAYGRIPDDVYLRYVPASSIDNREAYKSTYATLCDEKLLAIDDLGAEGTEHLDFGTVTTPVIDLIEYRYTRRLFTCFSTNLPLKELKLKYGSRIADRFNEMCEYIGFAGESYR